MGNMHSENFFAPRFGTVHAFQYFNYKLESRKVAGSNDYFGNLVIFKIYELNSVRFTVILVYKSGVAIFYHKGNYKLTNARTYLFII